MTNSIFVTLQSIYFQQVDVRLLDILHNDTVAAIPSSSFYPERAIIVTWFDMLYERYECSTCVSFKF